jgi:excisionase family DNA binding protein
MAGVSSGGVERGGLSLDEPLLDCAGAAELLSVRVSWVRDATRRGHLPCLRIGRHLRFTRPMLEEWLAAQAAGRRVGAQPGGAGRGARGPVVRRGVDAAVLAVLAERPGGSGGR